MEAKKAAIEDFLRTSLCRGKVEKVCLEPDSSYMFLDLDRQVALGSSILNIPAKSLVSLDEYLENLFAGAYHVDAIEELEKALMKVEQNRDQIDIKLGVGLERIEADMTSLCNRITNRIADYFTDLIARLQAIHLENHKEVLSRFDKLEQIMKKKIDLKASVNAGEEFNLNTFYNKFKIMQKEPEKLEKFLQSQIKRKIRYDAFSEEKDLKGFQDLYDEKSTFEENLINYVDNSRKLSQLHKQLQLEPESLKVPAAAETALTTKIIQFIESTVGSASHFEQSSALSDSARKSRPAPQDTLTRALQRAGYSKSLKTPPQTPQSSSQTPLPNTSPFVQSPLHASSSTAAAAPVIVSQHTALTSNPAELLLLDTPAKLKQYLDDPAAVYFGAVVLALNGKDCTASQCERAAQAVLSFESLEGLRVEIADVLGVPAGRLERVREALVAKASQFAKFELVLRRSKLNRQEIRAFGDMFAKMDSLDSIVLDLEE